MVAHPALITDSTDDAWGRTEPGSMFTSAQAVGRLADKHLHWLEKMRAGAASITQNILYCLDHYFGLRQVSQMSLHLLFF